MAPCRPSGSGTVLHHNLYSGHLLCQSNLRNLKVQTVGLKHYSSLSANTASSALTSLLSTAESGLSTRADL